MAETKVFKEELDVTSNRPHYNALYYSTGGDAGGQVISNSEVTQAFDTSDPNAFGITAVTGASAYLQVARAGVYLINLQETISDVSSTTFIAWIGISTDAGASYTRFRFYTDAIVSDTDGRIYTMSTWLPANARIKITIYNGGGATRIGSPVNDANNRYYFGPKLTVTELGRSS